MGITTGKRQIEFGTGAALLSLVTKNWSTTLTAGRIADDRKIILTLMAQKPVGNKKYPAADGAGAIFEKKVVLKKGQEGLFQVHGYLFSHSWGHFTFDSDYIRLPGPG
jgi:hypothetical protein